MTIDGWIKLHEWLEDEINEAEDEAADSHKLAMNSYGAGYDRGYADALKHVKEHLEPPHD
jgi:hypothetical protein